MVNLVSPRVASAARYLWSYSDSPATWRASRDDCPVCGRSIFVALGPTAFLTRCLGCKANATNLSLIPVIAKHLGGDYAGRSAYELSTFGATLKWLQAKVHNVTTSEYFPHAPFGQTVGGLLNQDVQELTFPDKSFDIVTHNQVFEHVADDRKGLRECARVLKTGGAMVCSIPLHDVPATMRKAYVDDEGNIQFIGTPEYHDSRLGGPNSAPVFWWHSTKDIARRVAEAGFSRVELVDVMISKAQRRPEVVIYAVK